MYTQLFSRKFSLADEDIDRSADGLNLTIRYGCVISRTREASLSFRSIIGTQQHCRVICSVSSPSVVLIVLIGSGSRMQMRVKGFSKSRLDKKYVKLILTNWFRDGTCG